MFLGIIKDLSINILLVDVLLEMTSYANFMKDLVTKNRLIDCETIVPPLTCSYIMTKNVILMKDDPGGLYKTMYSWKTYILRQALM